MRSSHLDRHRSKEAGFSLVEVLVALAITVMIGVSITSVLMSIAANNHRDLKKTNYHESLRLVAHVIMQDARQATQADPGWGESLEFRYGSPGDYIRYTFAAWDGTAEGAPDSQNLHRWVVKGGSLERDEIVAWDLVAPDFGNPDATEFAAESTSAYRSAEATLVKPPLPGQTSPMRIRITALLR